MSKNHRNCVELSFQFLYKSWFIGVKAIGIIAIATITKLTVVIIVTVAVAEA